MPAHWGTMEENIAASPLQYSTLKSVVPRFDAKYYGASVRALPAVQLRSAPPLPACVLTARLPRCAAELQDGGVRHQPGAQA